MLRPQLRHALGALPIIVFLSLRPSHVAAIPLSVTTVRPVAGPLPMLVDVAWLSKHYKDANVVLLHVGDPKEYAETHIPGARFIEMKNVSAPHERGDTKTLTLEFPSPEELRATFAALGISNDSHIIVYYGNDWVSPSTRIIHTLNYIGLGDHVSLLDGGMQLWKKAGNPVTGEPTPPAKPGKLTALPTKDVTVTGAWVNAHRNDRNVKIIDARSKNFYDGQGMGGMGRQGHIENAVSLPFTEVADDNNVWLSKEALAAKFKAAGVSPSDTVVVYCHIGQQGTAVVFAGRELGYNIRLYDGSFEDWDRHAEWPVTNPSEKKGQ